MIGGLLKQFITALPSIPEVITNAFRSEGQGSLRLTTACRMLRVVLRSFDCAYICIDALDECSDDDREVLLRSVGQAMQDSTRLFLTSRPSVESNVNHHLGTKSPVVIQFVANQQDIEKYITHRIDEDNRPDIMNNSLRNEIVTTISAASEQM
jgi:hypothetical protein